MRRNNIIFLIILVLFIIAAVIVFPLSTKDGGLLGNRPVKLGVDLNGGTSIIYKADLSIHFDLGNAHIVKGQGCVENWLDRPPAFFVNETEPVILHGAGQSF